LLFHPIDFMYNKGSCYGNLSVSWSWNFALCAITAGTSTYTTLCCHSAKAGK